MPLTNLIARFNPGSRDRLLFLAHWDTRLTLGQSKYTGPHTPVPGANDGASGTAVLLRMADALKKSPPKVGGGPAVCRWRGLRRLRERERRCPRIGSRYYAGHLPPGQLPLYAVLFDLVADRRLKLLPEGQSLLAAPEVVELVWNTARKSGTAASRCHSPGLGPTLIDDHVELQKVGIRAIDVVDFAYPDSVERLYWHTPADNLDKVSAQSLQVVGDVGMALVRKAER